MESRFPYCGAAAEAISLIASRQGKEQVPARNRKAYTERYTKHSHAYKLLRSGFIRRDEFANFLW